MPHGQQDENIVREFLFRELIVPFSEHLIEKLGEQTAILTFILRYKHRSEWFYQDKLWMLIENEKKKVESKEKKHAFVEDKLASDLYAYLYDEGINFYIAPSSINGRIDLIEEGKRPLLEGQMNISHRLLADAKVFDNETRDQNYIGKGFGQILDYCEKYNERFGYLIIYNISGKNLKINLQQSINEIPVYQYLSKNIFFLTINVMSKSSSKIGKVDDVFLEEHHLFINNYSHNKKGKNST